MTEKVRNTLIAIVLSFVMLSDNIKVNKRLAQAGFGYLKIGKQGGI